MRILRNFNIKEKIKFSSILKYFTLTLLIWICYLKSDKHIFVRYIENEYKVDRTLFASFNRLLAKHVIQEEFRSNRRREFLSDNIINKNEKNVLKHTSTYGQLNKREKNDLYLYKKGYKRRYSEKNVLGKFDCYCEKKVFDKIDDIDKLIEKTQNDKKLLKKILCHKSGICFIIFSLIPIIGLIIPLVHYGYFQIIPKCFNDCKKIEHKKDASGGEYAHNDDAHPKASINKSTWGAIYIVNRVLYCVSALIVLSTIIYIFIKFIKYQKLKACKNKMSIKEYCTFCKSLFI